MSWGYANIKALRDKRRAAGHCIQCGKRDAEPKKLRCGACLKATADRYYAKKGTSRTKQYRAQLSNAPRASHDRTEETDEEACRVSPGERCRCGLLLPCNDCIPTATEMAQSRDGALRGQGLATRGQAYRAGGQE